MILLVIHESKGYISRMGHYGYFGNSIYFINIYLKNYFFKKGIYSYNIT